MPVMCGGTHLSGLCGSIVTSSKQGALPRKRKTTMTSMATKIYGALIGASVFFALGAVMAHAATRF